MISYTILQIILQLQYLGLIRDLSADWGSTSETYKQFLDFCAAVALNPRDIIKHTSNIPRTYAAFLGIACVMPLIATIVLSLATTLWIETVMLVALVVGGVMTVLGLTIFFSNGSGISSAAALTVIIVGASLLVLSLVLRCIFARCCRGRPRGLRSWLLRSPNDDEDDEDDDDVSQLPTYTSQDFRVESTPILAQQQQQQQQNQAHTQTQAGAGAAASAAPPAAPPADNTKKIIVLVLSALFFLALILLGALHFAGVLFSSDPDVGAAADVKIQKADLHDLLFALFVGAVAVGSIGLSYIAIIAVAVLSRRAPATAGAVSEGVARFTRVHVTKLGLGIIMLLVVPITQEAVDIFICNEVQCPTGYYLPAVLDSTVAQAVNISDLCVPDNTTAATNESEWWSNNTTDNNTNATSSAAPATGAVPWTSHRLRSDLAVTCGWDNPSYIFLFAAAVVMLVWCVVTAGSIIRSTWQLIFHIRALEPEVLVLSDYTWRRVIGRHSGLFGLISIFDDDCTSILGVAGLYRVFVAAMARLALPNWSGVEGVGPIVVTGLHLVWLIFLIARFPFRRAARKVTGDDLAIRVSMTIHVATLVANSSAVAAWQLRRSGDDGDKPVVDGVLGVLVGGAMLADLAAFGAVVFVRLRRWHKERREEQQGGSNFTGGGTVTAVSLAGVSSPLNAAAPATGAGGSNPNQQQAAALDADENSGGLNPYLRTAAPQQQGAPASAAISYGATAGQAQGVPNFSYMPEEDNLEQKAKNVVFLRSIVRKESKLLRTLSMISAICISLATGSVLLACMYHISKKNNNDE